MKIKSNLVRVIISGILCVSVMLCDAYFLLNYGVKENSFNPAQSKAEISLTPEKAEKSESNTTSSENSTKTAEKDAVKVSASAVKGKISEKFITPYTANTCYNSVYLKNNTDLNVDIKGMLEENLSFKIEKNDQPQVLILHTHATECFMNEERDYYTENDKTRSDNNNENTVALGKIITDKLNTAGIKTVHSEVQHDNPSYNSAYSNAAKTICSYLKKYPSIKVVIDLHRDSVSGENGDKCKLTTKINGKKAAQVMLVMGSQSGNVKNFPDYRENLKLAVRLQQTMEVMYPTLARSLSLMPKNYNESLTKGSMLLEVGTEANTLSEVKYSASLVADALIATLNTIK